MKRILLGLGAFATVLVVLPMFAAFEAHVVNVTATIENALAVNVTPIQFGNVFPEEVLHKPLVVNLSDSFVSGGNTGANSVTYFIRQKPKCGVPVPDTNPVQYSNYVQVSENDNGTPNDASDDTWVCPIVGTDPAIQSVALPSLCPFLSKHSDVTPDGIPDGNIDAFHGTLPWTVADSLSTTVHASLQKPADVTDTWDIDLHAPCFQGQCAQDNVVPPAYQINPSLEHAQLGCDLWVEVDGITKLQS